MYKQEIRYGGLWTLNYIKDCNKAPLKCNAIKADSSYSDGGNAQLIEGLDIPKNGTMIITIRKTTSGKKVSIDVKDDKRYYDDLLETGYSFGFFTNHYDHSCPSIGDFELKNIQIKVGKDNS